MEFGEIKKIGKAAVAAYLKVDLPSRNLFTGTEESHGNFGQNNQRPDSNDVYG
jgi:hypothetical protein